jgi:hypothetical protein
MDNNVKRSFSETIIIFDWDDTLLPHTFIQLTEFNPRVDSYEYESNCVLLWNHEDIVINLLNEALEYGNVYIVTNASKTWVTYSCDLYLPRVRSLLFKIPIISACDDYGKISPQIIEEWKYRAFHKLLSPFFKDTSENVKNIVSIGDMEYERQAILAVADNITRVTVKSIKLIETPTITNLTLQLTLLKQYLYRIITKTEHMDLEIKNYFSDNRSEISSCGDFIPQELDLKEFETLNDFDSLDKQYIETDSSNCVNSDN